MESMQHYLKQELYNLMQSDSFLFEFLQEGSLDGLWYWDLENQENEWMSPRFWQTLGYDPNEKKHLAKEWQDLIHPDDLEIAIQNFIRHSEDPSHPYDQVVRYRHKNGSTVWIRCRGIVIRDSHGKPVRMLGAHTDITKQKQAEEKLRQKTRDLERLNKKLRSELKILIGIIPICSHCKKIRDDNGYWNQLEAFIREYSEAEFSHSICPVCCKKLYPDLYGQLYEKD